ncbi:MAG TPA: DoxX family protein [Ktedonobacteraceae bacterium]|jgi:putative oxidoreductase|nr:DoxX family protein [Ktedonobacteraceae bacterium]
MPISLSLGLLLLRLAVGLTIAAHGAQKLFGWFGGSGFRGTVNMQEKMGFKPSVLWASLAILGEVGGGLSLAFGFLTPLGAAGIFGAMFIAVIKGHLKNGFWNSKRGFEYPLQLLAAAVALGLIGPGSFSLDALFGIVLPTPQLFIIMALAALLVDIIGLLISRPATPAAAPTSMPVTTSGEVRSTAS